VDCKSANADWKFLVCTGARVAGGDTEERGAEVSFCTGLGAVALKP
jgi:hypothetical protein